MTGLPRRKFIYVGAGVAVAAGTSYLTRDYWYSMTLEVTRAIYSHIFSKPNPSATTSTPPTTTTPGPPESPTPTTPATPQTPTKTMSEDEIMIKRLMDAWRDLYSTGNANNTINVYTVDATLDFGCSKTGVTKFSGPAMISSFIKGLYAAQRGKMDNQRIIELTIQGNEAYVVSYEDLKMNRGIAKWLSKFKLRKIVEIKRGSSTFKLSKPIWRIQEEYSHCASDG